jgi:UDPglucose 6-dehydrogenase
VPCGTADSLRAIFDALAPDVTFDDLSNPEFLAEATAINDLQQPDRILIGSLTDIRSKAAAESLAKVYSWVPRARIVTINLWSSELAKVAANCMLAQRISSINSLSAICEATGADIEELSYAVGLDARIGSKMLKASAGYGGSCFKKDVLSLVYIAEALHSTEVAMYWRQVVELNKYQKKRIAKRITRALYNTLARKKVAILGWAYKKNTGDTRESAAISIVGLLLPEGAEVAVYDPQVSHEQVFKDLETDCPTARQQVTVCNDAVSACSDAAAFVILTEWDEFKTNQLPSTNGQFNEQASIGYSAATSDSGIKRSRSYDA